MKWHIRQLSLSDYGHGTLESFAAAWMITNTYERKRPVWQIAILHLGDEGTMETGIVAKFSHSLVDGYSFVHMVGKLTDNPAPYLVKDKELTWKERVTKSLTKPNLCCNLLLTYSILSFQFIASPYLPVAP